MDGIESKYPGWEVLGTLGSGSFGKVYKIRKLTELPEDEYCSALKHICIPKDSDEVALFRADGYSEESIKTVYRNKKDSIKSEIQMMSKLKGFSNIVSYEDHCIYPHSDGIGYDILIRMELLTPLPKYFSEQSMCEEDVIKLGIDVCKALELCEKHQIIHRDIKPQNIFVNENGDFKLGDFGIARTYEGSTFGTLSGSYSYMAPEVILRQKYNSKIDIYSLAIVMYWALNMRRTPFMPLPPAVPTEADFGNAQQLRVSGEKLPRTVNGSVVLQRIIEKAAAFNPADRYASPSEMRQDLEMLAAGSASDQKTQEQSVNDNETVYMPRNKHTEDSDEKSDENQRGRNRKRKLKPLFACAAVILLAAIAAVFAIFGGKGSHRTLVDSDSGITVSGMIDKDSSFHVKTLPADSKEAAEMIEEGYEPIGFYDLSLDGTYKGELTVSFPVSKTEDKQKFLIVHRTDAKTEHINASAEDGFVSVDCSELSRFIILVSSSVAPEEIHLDFTNIGMVSGTKQQLTASLLPEGSVGESLKWTSSDEKIVKVDSNGMLSAISSGTAKVTVKCGELNAACNVTVSDKEIRATGLFLSSENLRMNVSETAYITASIQPKNATVSAVNWSSSDSGVVSVNNGSVFAKSAGKATITASAGGCTAKCTVTVNAPSTPSPSSEPSKVTVKSLRLSEESLRLEAGNNYKLTASVSPSNADNADVSWKSSNSAVASVNNGTVTAKSAGTAVITATAGGKSASCSVTVSQAPAGKAPTGYSISIDSKTVIKDIDFNIYVHPNEPGYTNITIYAISPGGEVYSFNMGTSTSKGLNCYIPGTWKVYAVISNEYGTYSGASSGPYLTFDVVSLI